MSFSLRLCVIVLTVYSTREDVFRLGDEYQHIYKGNNTGNLNTYTKEILQVTESVHQSADYISIFGIIGPIVVYLKTEFCSCIR